MNVQVQLALIGLMVVIVQGFFTYITNKKQDANHAETGKKLDEVKSDVNGKMNQLLKVNGDARQAQGKLEGLAERDQEKRQ